MVGGGEKSGGELIAVGAAAAPRASNRRRRIVLRDASLEVTVFPAPGARILSIRDVRDGHDYQWRAPGRPRRPPVYGARYVGRDFDAFDECFPTIDPCAYPLAPRDGVRLPDHGELWCTPWGVERDADAAGAAGGWRMWASGVRLPYRFERRIDLPAPGQLRLRYRLSNLTPYPFHSLWSAHPLFVVGERTRIVVPPVLRFRINHSRRHELGRLGDTIAWDSAVYAGGEPADLSRIRPGAGHAAKLYSEALAPGQGWAALHEVDSGRFAAIAFDPARVPYLGVWRNESGSPQPPFRPVENGAPYLHVGLEPCTGFPDRLDIGIQRGEHAIVAAHGEVTWEVRLVFGRRAHVDGLAPDGTLL